MSTADYGDWVTVSLKDVVAKLLDGSHSPPAKQDVGRPMLSARNIENNKIVFDEYRLISENDFMREHARSRVSPGDVLLTIVGTIGRSAVVPAGMREITLQRSVAVITPRGLISKYLMYQLQAPFIQRHFAAYARGTAQKGVYLKTLGETPIRLAPIEQQERIVAEIEKQFSRLDEAVANLKRVEAKLKRYKAAVLKAAIEGKLTEQWRKDHPDVEPATKLLERILADRRTTWQQAELLKMKAAGEEPEDIKWKERYKEPAAPDSGNLPQIPDGWQWYSSDQLFWFVTSGSRGWARYYSNAGPTFLRVGNLNHDSITLDLRDTRRVQPPTGAEGLRTRAEMDDVLISITADVGMIAVVPDGFGEGYINQHIALARPVGAVDAKYVAWYLASKLGQKQLQNLQRGATKAGLGLNDVRSTNIPLPPLLEQEEIELQIARRLSIVDEVNEEITINLRRAERLRQSILDKASSGLL
jgi:type I restriction enzyme S subunit